MANISKHERDTKAQCLWDAFSTLKELSNEDGHNLVSMKLVIELANEDERMKEFEKAIGEKSVYSKAKNSVYLPIVAAVKKWISEYKVEATKASTKARDKLDNMGKKLSSVESTVVLLQEKNHKLTQRLKNRMETIEWLELERNGFAEEVARLRKKYERA